MKIFRIKWVFLVPMVLLLFVIYSVMRKQFVTPNESCIKSFHDFAYLPDKTSRPIPEILPGFPWQVEATIPGAENATYRVPDIQIELARMENEEEEIWLFKSPSDSGSGSVSREGVFLIYHPHSQTWEEVLALIENTKLIVRDLFVTSDGTVWGQIAEYQPHSASISAPVLGKYNESVQRFEEAPGLNIPITLDSSFLSQPLEVVLDGQDIFWIFGPDDGIYRYDPKTQSTERQTDIPDMERLSTTLALDGSIYLQDKSLSKGKEFLFQFIPKTGEVIALDISREPWDTSSGMLVDQKGRLWLGATGYMEQDGSWHLLHPDAQKVWENRGEIRYWSPPVIIFESSNGWLWYAEYHDMERLGEGTAWYDPETEQGCLFTNIASYIVEDEKKQLWMVANEKLYRYPLEK